VSPTTEEPNLNIDALLHRLRMKAERTYDYDQEEWKDLEARLHALQTALQAHVEWEAQDPKDQTPGDYFIMMNRTTDALLKARGEKK
jgi:hypothetical protein